MAIKPVCNLCKKELDKFGALLFSPQDKKLNVKKWHICLDCYNKLEKYFNEFRKAGRR